MDQRNVKFQSSIGSSAATLIVSRSHLLPSFREPIILLVHIDVGLAVCYPAAISRNKVSVLKQLSAPDLLGESCFHSASTCACSALALAPTLLEEVGNSPRFLTVEWDRTGPLRAWYRRLWTTVRFDSSSTDVYAAVPKPGALSVH